MYRRGVSVFLLFSFASTLRGLVLYNFTYLCSLIYYLVYEEQALYFFALLFSVAFHLRVALRCFLALHCGVLYIYIYIFFFFVLRGVIFLFFLYSYVV